MKYKKYEVEGRINLSVLYKSLNYEVLRKKIKNILPPNQGFTVEESIKSMWKEKGKGKVHICYKIILKNEGESTDEDFKKIQSKLEEVLGGELIEIN